MFITELKNKIIVFFFLVVACFTSSTFTITKEEALNTLGLGENATKEHIEKAYRRLAFKYHPDRNQGSTTAETFMAKVNEARDYFREAEKEAAIAFEDLRRCVALNRANNFELAGQLLSLFGVPVLFRSLQAMHDEYYAYHNKNKKWSEIFTWRDYVPPVLGASSIIAAIICLLKAENIRKSIA